MKPLSKNKAAYRQIKLQSAKIKASFENPTEENYKKNLNFTSEQCRECLQNPPDSILRSLPVKLEETFDAQPARSTDADHWAAFLLTGI